VQILPQGPDVLSIQDVKLTFFRRVNSSEQKNVFRILFWSAFIGKKIVVDQIIRMGYSPFLKVYKEKNALMAAVEG